jgi:acylphosphatase
MIVGRRVTYSGQVQGVGFRYTTRQLAQGFAVAGFVRNLPDGRVEVLAEGAVDQVESFLKALEVKMSDFIADRLVRDAPPEGTRAFVIRH